MQIIPTMLTSHPSENSNHQEDNTGRVEDKEEPFYLHTWYDFKLEYPLWRAVRRFLNTSKSTAVSQPVFLNYSEMIILFHSFYLFYEHAFLIIWALPHSNILKFLILSLKSSSTPCGSLIVCLASPCLALSFSVLCLFQAAAKIWQLACLAVFS